MSRFWLLSTMLFYLLLGDAALRIHENVGPYLGGEARVFGMYGILLLTIVGIYWRSFRKLFWWFFLAFVVFSGVAVLGDSGGHEGIIMIAGQRRSYEQFCETFSMLLLGAGFATEAIQDLTEPSKPGFSTGRYSGKNWKLPPTTVCWERGREGINDAKYLHIFQKASERHKLANNKYPSLLEDLKIAVDSRRVSAKKAHCVWN